MFVFWCGVQILIVEIKWFVVVIYIWQMWVSKDFFQQQCMVIYVWLQFIVDFMDLVVFLFFLIFLVIWKINVRFIFYVVELCVFYIFVIGLDVFIGD